jgi:hypothetical protein
VDAVVARTPRLEGTVAAEEGVVIEQVNSEIPWRRHEHPRHHGGFSHRPADILDAPDPT